MERDAVNRVFRCSQIIVACLPVAALTFTLLAAKAPAQFKKGAKVPPNFDFGFLPGRKVFYEGVFRIDDNPKGKLEALNQMVDPKEKSVVIYTRQTDDAILKLIAALDAKGENLKDCPTHFVFLFADREMLAKKTRGSKHVSLLLSNRKGPQDWGIFDIDPKLLTMVLLVERGTIKTKLEVMEGMVSDARMDELAKAILAYASPVPPSPTAPKDIKDRLAGHPGGARSMVFSPDGKWLYSHGTQQDIGVDARISKWELATGKRVGDVASHGGGAYSLQLTRDGKTLLSIGSNNEVKFWDAADLKLLDTIKLAVPPFGLRISPDQKTFAVGGGIFRDNPIRVFDLATKKEKFALKGHDDRVRAVDYSPDSKLLVSGDEKGTIKLWDMVEGKEIANWTGNTTTIECMSFSPDGKWVATGGRELNNFGAGRARLWNVETGKEVRELESTRVGRVLALAFLDGGKKLAIAGDVATIRLIDLQTGKEAGELNGHGPVIMSFALSPNGEILASGEWRATIRLWNWSGIEKK
jgi:WD40 repeat protein